MSPAAATTDRFLSNTLDEIALSDACNELVEIVLGDPDVGWDEGDDDCLDYFKPRFAAILRRFLDTERDRAGR